VTNEQATPNTSVTIADLERRVADLERDRRQVIRILQKLTDHADRLAVSRDPA